MKLFLKLAVFGPLISCLFAGLFHRQLSKTALIRFCGFFMGIATLAGSTLFMKMVKSGGAFAVTVPLMTWIEIGDFSATWALSADPLSVVMIFLVLVVSFLVHLYSYEYMEGEEDLSRYYAYLGLFTFAMLMLVSAQDLLQLFFGWEGVGVCSYLLIGYWYEKESANQAAMKAFLVNRVGDLFLVMGMAGFFYLTQTLEIGKGLSLLQSAVPEPFVVLGTPVPALDVLGILFLIGAMGKSAQLGLHTWLPDAMEGPTPVSALIHAATMVTAGVYLIARLSPLYLDTTFASTCVVWVGALTAFAAGTIALVQNDIKKVIAYSTCSQLGYMFLGLGVGAYNGAVFHLFTHGFFKALLFLGAGAVIHSMSNEQDMRKMGGLYRPMKMTFAFMLIGSLALVGFPLFSGFYSKEAILASAFAAQDQYGLGPWVLSIISLVLTAAYTGRMLGMTFLGRSRADEALRARIHEPGLMMNFPLALLALGALVSGMLGYKKFLMGGKGFWGDKIVAPLIPHHVGIVELAPTVVGICVFVLALVVFRKWKEKKLAKSIGFMERFLVNKWYFDALYQALFVKPVWWLGQLFWVFGDQKGIDAIGPDGLTHKAVEGSLKLRRSYTGLLPTYIAALVMGVLLLIVLILFGGGRLG